MKRTIAALVLAASMGAALLGTGCAGGPIESGWHESEGRGNWKVEFGAYTGTRTHALDAAGARWIDLDYSAAVEDGALALILRDANGDVVWDIEATSEEQADSVEIPLPEAGDYTFVAFVEDATGRFDLSWKVR